MRAAFFGVNSTLDIPDINPGNGVCEISNGGGVCTLRAAIMETNALPGNDGILLSAGIYQLSRAGDDDTALDGDFDITGTVSIYGGGAAVTIIDGNASLTNDRVFDVQLGASLTVWDATIQNGKQDSGGGIYNLGSVDLRETIVRDNTALTGAGGGISSYGAVYLYRTVIEDNEALANGLGGGIYNEGYVNLVDSTIRNNTSARYGGGIYNAIDGDLLLLNSTISGNQADEHGGGLFLSNSNTTLLNTTIAANTADADNDSSAGGGGLYTIGASIVELYNSLLANNFERVPFIPTFWPDDCFGVVTSEDYNLIETTSDCTINGLTTHNITGVDPQLADLGDYGGISPTHALLPGSPAIDAGNPAGCRHQFDMLLLTTDQRGMPRPANGDWSGDAVCDIGSFELQARVYLPILSR